MASTVFAAVASLFMLVGCSVSRTYRADSGKTVYNMQNSVPTQTSATTTTIATAVSPSFLRSTLKESSHVNITVKGEARDNEIAERATRSHYNVLDGNHELREKKERKLLAGDESDMKSSSGYLVTERHDSERNEYLHDSVHHFVTAKGKSTSAVSVKGSINSSLKPLYELYSLISYVAAASEGKSENDSKASDSVHLNSLYSLYSLVAYVVDADDINGLKTGGNRVKYGGTTLEISRPSALHREKQTSGRLNETSSDYSKWTYHIAIALSVVAAVALMLVVAMCLVRYCRRAKVDRAVATRPMVRGTGSPGT